MKSRAQVLVVEDERIVAMEILDRLTHSGYHAPASVATGEEAVRTAEEIRPDLVLMDIRLRDDMDGITAAEFSMTSIANGTDQSVRTNEKQETICGQEARGEGQELIQIQKQTQSRTQDQNQNTTQKHGKAEQTECVPVSVDEKEIKR